MPSSDTQFRPGTSGNPGGRPRNTGEIRTHAQAYAHRAIFSLARQCISPEVPPRDRRAAAKLLIRIGFGPASNLGDAILRQLGWHQVRAELELEAQIDERDHGATSLRRLEAVHIAGKVSG